MTYRQTVFAILAVTIMMSPVVRAETAESSLMLNDEQINLIRDNCRSVQKILTNIHSTDALSRVRLGQEYETISTKFMAPMNSRIALAKLDGVALAKASVDFDARLDTFRDEYQQYEQIMLKAMQIKCNEQPLEFYDALVQARSHRETVRGVVDAMSVLIKQYRVGVEAAQAQLHGKEKAGK